MFPFSWFREFAPPIEKNTTLSAKMGRNMDVRYVREWGSRGLYDPVPKYSRYDIATQIWLITFITETPFLTLIPEWISNHISSKVWDEITFRIPKLQRCSRWSLGMGYVISRNYLSHPQTSLKLLHTIIYLWKCNCMCSLFPLVATSGTIAHIIGIDSLRLWSAKARFHRFLWYCHDRAKWGYM